MSVDKTLTQPPYRNLKQLQKLYNVASFDVQPQDGHMDMPRVERGGNNYHCKK